MKPLILLLITAACFSSCKKTDPATLTKLQLISQQSWKLIAGTQQQLPAGTVQDLFAPMSACYRDDEYVYSANLNYEGNAGAAKCAAADPQVFATGTWRFINNETQVERTTTAGIGIGTVIFQVVQLTESRLQLKSTDANFEYLLTFSH